MACTIVGTLLNGVLVKLRIFALHVRSSPHFVEPEHSLPRSQGPATCPSTPSYPVPFRSMLKRYPAVYAQAFQLVSFLQVSPPKMCIFLLPLRTTFLANVILDLIPPIEFGEECNSRRSSLQYFLHTHVTFFLLLVIVMFCVTAPRDF